ncbi:iron-containing redox enzyme family protein [Pendulispora brunnea]|uniref:Iron-containing redox enzyme family protein n=1 Tax=Pendulispora brunnea TaxID=2905690 RepID=A0ABZ2KDK8_9BACT
MRICAGVFLVFAGDVSEERRTTVDCDVLIGRAPGVRGMGNKMAPSTTFDLHNQVNSLMSDLERHPVYGNDYFKFLENSAWTRQTYDFHRANFFHRTEGTVKGIAHVCARAAANDDRDTLILFAYILNEETGNGNRAHCHEVFMENAHNLHGQAEFDLPSLLVKDARSSKLILDETVAYRKRTLELLSGSYHRMLGVVMALESHADKMLRICRTAFRASRKNLTQSDFVKKVEVYFNAHVSNGVEERHAADAKQCVINNCQTEADIAEIAYGANETLNIQLAMWNAMYEKACALNAAPGAR